eukprot:g4250.t1
MQDSGPRGTPRPSLQSGGEGNAKQRSQQPERKDSRKRKETPAGGSGSQFAKHPPARVAGGKRVKSARQTTGDSTYAGFNGAVMAAVFRMAVDAPSPLSNSHRKNTTPPSTNSCGILENLVSLWENADDKPAFVHHLARRQRVSVDYRDAVSDLLLDYTRRKVSRFIWRLSAGNRCALCLEECNDDTMEMAHVFRDGRMEPTYIRGVTSVEARRAFTRGYGLELMESGRVVMLCPNCHCRYDRGTSQISTSELRERGRQLFQQYHGLGKRMEKMENCLLVEEGFGRPQFRKLCNEVDEPVLPTLELKYTPPSASQEAALDTLARVKGLDAVKCEALGCNVVDCLEIHGDTVRHGQLYNRPVQLLPSKRLIFLRSDQMSLKLTTLVWKEDGSLEEGVAIDANEARRVFQGNAEFKGQPVYRCGALCRLVASGLLAPGQLATMGILCRHHNLAVERSLDRVREERRRAFAAAYRVESRKAKLQPRSVKEERIELFMRTHSREEFCFYTAVDEVQLRLLALDHFAEEGEAAVADLRVLLTNDGKHSSLKGAVNRGNSRDAAMLLFSSSTKNLRNCNHRRERGGNGEWILVERGGAAKGKWIARVYIRANTGNLECADCSSEKQLARQRKREMDGTKRKRRRTGWDDEVMALKRVHIGHGNQ